MLGALIQRSLREQANFKAIKTYSTDGPSKMGSKPSRKCAALMGTLAILKERSRIGEDERDPTGSCKAKEGSERPQDKHCCKHMLANKEVSGLVTAPHVGKDHCINSNKNKTLFGDAVC